MSSKRIDTLAPSIFITLVATNWVKTDAQLAVVWLIVISVLTSGVMIVVGLRRLSSMSEKVVSPGVYNAPEKPFQMKTVYFTKMERGVEGTPQRVHD